MSKIPQKTIFNVKKLILSMLVFECSVIAGHMVSINQVNNLVSTLRNNLKKVNLNLKGLATLKHKNRSNHRSLQKFCQKISTFA